MNERMYTMQLTKKDVDRLLHFDDVEEQYESAISELRNVIGWHEKTLVEIAALVGYTGVTPPEGKVTLRLIGDVEVDGVTYFRDQLLEHIRNMVEPQHD